MTGRLPSRTGVYDNAAEFRSDIPTFAHYLRRAGYRTVLAGKMHFCGPDQLHGFEERLTTDIYPADFGWTPDWDQPHDRPSWYHNMSSVTDAGPCVRTNQIDFDDEVVFAAERMLYDHVRGTRRAPVLPGRLADPSARPVRDRRSEYWDLYAGRATSIRRATGFDPAQLTPHERRLRHVCDMDGAAVTAEHVRAARRAYYGAISYVDDQVGRLRAALAATGLADDTVVILSPPITARCSASAARWYKMSFFEGACRVPLVVHAPARFRPRRVAAAVSLVDLLPTLVGPRRRRRAAPLGDADRGAQPPAPSPGRAAATTRRSANIWPRVRSRRS